MTCRLVTVGNIFFLLKGRLRVEYADQDIELMPGDVLDVELWKYHQILALEPSLILEISQPCIVSDNYFENPEINIGQNYTPTICERESGL